MAKAKKTFEPLPESLAAFDAAEPAPMDAVEPEELKAGLVELPAVESMPAEPVKEPLADDLTDNAVRVKLRAAGRLWRVKHEGINGGQDLVVADTHDQAVAAFCEKHKDATPAKCRFVMQLPA